MMIKLFIVFFCLVKLGYCLKIYQQTHYSLSAYFKYFIKHFIYLNLFVILVLIVALFMKHPLSDGVVGVYLIIYCLLFYRRDKKKLVYTKRVIRLLTVLSLAFISIIWVDSRYALSITAVFYEYLIMLAFLIMSVVEKIISSGFLKSAHKKLLQADIYTIAITGSGGKTTTKYLLGELLGQIESTLYTEHSYNTPLGIAKTINKNNLVAYENLVLEFGAAKKGDIGVLKRLYPYRVAIITSVLPTHLDTFKTLDNILHEKCSIADNYENLEVLIYNAENEFLRDYKFKTKATVLSYGLSCGKYQARNASYEPTLSFDFYKDDNLICHVNSKLIGEHNILNILACYAYGEYRGYDLNIFNKAMMLLKNFENRLTVKYYPKYILYDDSFNSNIKGALGALNMLSKAKGLRCIMTPGFAEVNSPEILKQYASMIANSCDLCVLVGIYETRNLYFELEKYNLNIVTVNNIHEGYKVFFDFLGEQFGFLLIENDLPDTYLRRFI